MKYFFIVEIKTLPPPPHYRHTTATTMQSSTATTADTTYLAKQNMHPRDQRIHFDEGPHKYTIQGIQGADNITPETEFTSVTTWVHQHFDQFHAKNIIAGMMRNKKKWNDPVANFKYYGKTAEEIEQMWSTAGKEAAAKGTEMHYKIECFYNTTAATATPETATTPADTEEMQQFMNFQRDFSATLKPYRTEWTVFHEEARIAGSIDMVYELIEPHATTATATATATTEHPLVIYDWKRCREISRTNQSFKFATHPTIEHLPDSNYWHYALQLNIYKYILLTKYGKTVTDLFLVVLHPDAQNYNRIKLPDLQSEVQQLFEERIQKFADK